MKTDNLNPKTLINELQSYILDIQKLENQDLSNEQLQEKLGAINQKIRDNSMRHYPDFYDYSKEQLAKDLITYIDTIENPETTVDLFDITDDIFYNNDNVNTERYAHQTRPMLENNLIVDLFEETTADNYTMGILDSYVEAELLEMFTQIANDPNLDSIYETYNNINLANIYMKSAYEYHLEVEGECLDETIAEFLDIDIDKVQDIDISKLNIGHLKLIANELYRNSGTRTYYSKEEILTDLLLISEKNNSRE